MRLSDLRLISSLEDLAALPSGKLRINTMYAYSFSVLQKDDVFSEAISTGDALTPDGQSIVWAAKFLKMHDAPKRRIAGWDLFIYEMSRVEAEAEKAGVRKKVMFMGSSDKVLALIKERTATDYPQLDVVTFSPPYRAEFSLEDNTAIVDAINEANPDLLWIGMTAPKQEKWAYEHWNELKIHCHCGTIGAVFDFYAGTVKRAPLSMQNSGLEWLYRLIKEPGRMWRRYLIGNVHFIWLVLLEKIHISIA